MFISKKNTYFLLISALMLSSCKDKTKHDHPSGPSHDLSRALEMKDVAPVVIIGSGPAGLTAAMYVARAGMKAFVFAGPQPCGQLTGTTFIENWPGKMKSMGPDLMNDIKAQAESFGACIINDTVTDIDFDCWPFAIKTDNGRSFSALSIIVATGATPRRLDIPGESEYWGKGVTTCAVCDAPLFKGKTAVIVGGGDTAAEQVFELAPYAKHITILVRKDSLRAGNAQQDRVLAYDNVSIEFNKELKTVLGNGKEVTGIEIFDNKNNTVEERSIDGVFLAIGHVPNSALLPNKMKRKTGYLSMIGRSQQTKIPGVFAAGEIQDSVYRQAIVAAGEGAKAALDATGFLYEIGFNQDISRELEQKFFETFSENRLEIVEITKVEEFQELVVNKKGLVLLDFYGDHCPGCIKMLPILEIVAHDMQDKVTIVKANTQKARSIIEHLYFDHKIKIKWVPSLLVYRDGKYLETNSLIMDQKELKKYVSSFLD
jgi:thioredoxin reductase (NADPH)